MNYEIKSSILSKESISDLINKEDINLLNANITEFEINNTISQNDIRANNLEKAKELLKKLLKETLDGPLTLLEKKGKPDLNQLETTSKLTKEITNLVTKMNKQILEKLKKDKEKQSKKTNKNSGNRKGLSPHKSGVSKARSSYRSKTPMHLNSKTGNNHPNKTPIITKREIKNKSNISVGKNFKTIDSNKNIHNVNIQTNIGNKTKSNINIKKKNHNDLNDLHSISIVSVKTNKTNKTTLNTITNSRINNKFKNTNKNQKQNNDLTLNKNQHKTNNTKMKKHNTDFALSENDLIYLDKKTITQNNSTINLEEKRKRKKTPFKKKSINNKEENVKIINTIKKREKTIEDEIEDILSMETNLQKEIDLNNNDPLLILPLKDLDFIPKMLLRRSSTRMENPNREKQYGIISFNIQINLEKIKFNNILKYLSLNDLLSIKNISKTFHQLIILYLIDYLEKEQINLIEITNNLYVKEIPDREGIEKFVLSKKSKQAIQLLNEVQLNTLFKDDKIPIDDIILIYRIYFQLINHPFALIAKTDIEKFWDKCKYYFRNEQNGKVGDILVDMIKNKKIETNRNNLYQIYNLVRGNWNKIKPKYFSSVCSTTGLFVLIIKDILEYLGLSVIIQKKENAYWTYSDIIEAIKDKVNYLKKNKI